MGLTICKQCGSTDASPCFGICRLCSSQVIARMSESRKDRAEAERELIQLILKNGPPYKPEDLNQDRRDAISLALYSYQLTQPMKTSLFHHLKSNLDAWFWNPLNEKWTGCLNRVGYAFAPAFSYGGEIEDALTRLHLEGFYTVEKHGADYHISRALSHKDKLKKAILAWYADFKHKCPGPVPIKSTYEGISRGVAHFYPGGVWDEAEFRAAFEGLANEGNFYFHRHQASSIYYTICYTITPNKPGKTLKQAILDWHRGFYEAFKEDPKACSDTFRGFQTALRYYGAPAQYTEAEFQAALCDISRDGTFNSEGFRNSSDDPWTWKVFPGQLKSLGSDECKPRTIVSEFKYDIKKMIEGWLDFCFEQEPKLSSWEGVISTLRWGLNQRFEIQPTALHYIAGLPDSIISEALLDVVKDKGFSVEVTSSVVCGKAWYRIKPQTTTAQLKTAILAWHKRYFSWGHSPGQGPFKGWVEVLAKYGAPVGDYIGGAGYSATEFEIALRQLAEEENIPSKRASERVTACSEYYIFPRGTSYEKVKATGSFSLLDTVIWCYAKDVPPMEAETPPLRTDRDGMLNEILERVTYIEKNLFGPREDQ